MTGFLTGCRRAARARLGRAAKGARVGAERPGDRRVEHSNVRWLLLRSPEPAFHGVEARVRGFKSRRGAVGAAAASLLPARRAPRSTRADANWRRSAETRSRPASGGSRTRARAAPNSGCGRRRRGGASRPRRAAVVQSPRAMIRTGCRPREPARGGPGLACERGGMARRRPSSDLGSRHPPGRRHLRLRASR